MLGMIHRNLDLQLISDETGQIKILVPVLNEAISLPAPEELLSARAAFQVESILPEPAERIGTELFELVFPPNSRARSAFEEGWRQVEVGACKSYQLRLIIRGASPHSIPWELLHLY